MNKPLLLSLAAVTILSSNLNAQSMYERIQSMELQMKQMKEELDSLKAQKEQEEKTLAKDEKSDVAQIKTAIDTKESDMDEEDDDEESLEEKLAEIEENLSDLNKITNGNHLKFDVDYRFTWDYLHYEMADGTIHENDGFLTNRFWLNMNWAANKHLSFRAQLSYYKSFGERMSGPDTQYSNESFDWIVNENPYDDTLKLRSAYFLYANETFFNADIPWTFSIGRRPSTNGHLINLREDESPASPLAHSINVEFDGLSSKFELEDLTGVDGMYIKFCAGRAITVAQEKFTSTPYADDRIENQALELGGFIFVPYDNGQYSVLTQYYYASNLIDQDFNTTTGTALNTFTSVGDMHNVTASFLANGIGDGISEFLDDTTFFISGSMNVTVPKDSQRMLYSKVDTSGNLTEPGESKTGYSLWTGVQIPSLLTEDGRWGFEYNWGSQYWKSITYAEDTLIGSKVATRGSAYEAYFTEYLEDDVLSVQLRYTYIDYEYKGSNGFFGSTTGAADKISEIKLAIPRSRVIDNSQDVRLYLRYKY